MKMRRFLPALLVVLALGCSGDDSSSTDPDAARPPDATITDGPSDAAITDGDGPASTPDQGLATPFKVAAVQYGKDKYAAAPGCTDDVCALVYFGKQAAQAGARLVLFPEYAIYQKYPWDPPPQMGDMPATDSAWASTAVVRPFAKLAADEKIYLVFNLKTQQDVSGTTHKHNTSVAVDPAGKVVAVHHKFELYSTFEKTTFTAGTTIENSMFDTPAGKAGLLICADIHCVITNMQTTGPKCTSAGVNLVPQFAAKKPRLVLVSNYWFTAADTPIWGSIVVGTTLAKSMQAYVATSNTTQGAGYGGAIYDPQGAVLAQEVKTVPSVVYAEIPLPGS